MKNGLWPNYVSRINEISIKKKKKGGGGKEEGSWIEMGQITLSRGNRRGVHG